MATPRFILGFICLVGTIGDGVFDRDLLDEGRAVKLVRGLEGEGLEV